MIAVTCVCGTELDEPGALYFTAPEPGSTHVEKHHLCGDCAGTIELLLSVIRDQANLDSG